MYLLGYDIGSSSIKVALVKAENGAVVEVVQHPATELGMIAHHPGWAEQHPETWWDSLCQATQMLLKSKGISTKEIASIGIAYQMHGLVLVDENQKVLRPSIIWCDSRAVEIGNRAFRDIGEKRCLEHLLNSPGNFTASKLKWVRDNEPDLYKRIHKFMLPGDYIAMKLTGNICTTISGLSEGILWDFKENTPAYLLLDYYGIDTGLLPEIKDTFCVQGKLTREAAAQTGLAEGTPVSYRAGDQPNNALSLGVYQPDSVAATGGTSGVVYGVVDEARYDLQSRINGFAHVNHQPEAPRLGLLLCINGAGIQYAWLRQHMSKERRSYSEMEQMAASVSIGADGLRIIPFGNGAERMLCNANPGAQVNNLQFNRHGQEHFYRAALEGIAFSFVYGFQVLKELGLNPKIIKVGNDNLFQSRIFSSTVSNLLNCSIEVIETTGAVGAAKASGIATAHYSNLNEAFQNNTVEQVFHPENQTDAHVAAYQLWLRDLEKLI